MNSNDKDNIIRVLPTCQMSTLPHYYCLSVDYKVECSQSCLPAFLLSCIHAPSATISKYHSCSILHLVKENKKKNDGRLELKRSTGNNQTNKHCARPHLRLAVPPNSH